MTGRDDRRFLPVPPDGDDVEPTPGEVTVIPSPGVLHLGSLVATDTDGMVWTHAGPMWRDTTKITTGPLGLRVVMADVPNKGQMPGPRPLVRLAAELHAAREVLGPSITQHRLTDWLTENVPGEHHDDETIRSWFRGGYWMPYKRTNTLPEGQYRVPPKRRGTPRG